ncbi:cell surface biosynthesis and architecture modulator, putative [Candida dubliniensis CD36]|uniref:Cell surface biosynthesis and architecture modulator, putative n=1 Tax=Candida dubliniensis (strain CD36 / ATCC MYA-646 / CBS 7987 / NCPF 3949 / NRRL Y-17841) TaxID=573826 RepID=B9W9V4_CANDC|nr:cell surface biosynthesis and architecture modulator, putative [Candida dubliniensis CD36]CAX45591.1 cell surface biosynthesis and architecture modulator, putative [Candida dubliniensis CD36]
MDRIFYKSDLRDPTTNYPIYIFDTSYLPSPDIINYNEFLITLMSYLPIKPYVLIMFSCGLNKISWIWGIKFIQKILNRRDLKNLIKVYTVHDSWFLKSMTSILQNFNSTRKNLEQLDQLLGAFTFVKELNNPTSDRQTLVIHCQTLSELSYYLDITNLKISYNIFKHDLQISELKLSMRYQPIIHPLITLNVHEYPIFHHHLYQIFKIVENNCNKVELILYKPGNKFKCDILYQCILRNQLIWINDWDLYSIATLFKRILSELPFPLIDIELIRLPIGDNLQYTFKMFKRLINRLQKHQETQNYDQLLFQILDMCQKIVNNDDITKHTTTTISKGMSYCLSHELVSTNKTNIQIINRFLKNLLEYWSDIRKHFQIYTIDNVIDGKLQTESVSTSHETSSYDLSHDITLDQESESSSSNSSSNDDDEENGTGVDTDFIETKDILRNLSLNNTDNSPATTTNTSSSSTKSNGFHQRTTSVINKTIDPINNTKSHKKSLSDVSNLQIQYPPQKYKFSTTTTANISPRKNDNITTPKKLNSNTTNNSNDSIPIPKKKPVIRGRKVGQLAKLFEERCEGIEILRGMT